MAQPLWQQQVDDESWSLAIFAASHPQSGHIDSEVNVPDCPELPDRLESLTEHPSAQHDGISFELDQKIAALLPHASSDVKHCILQLLLEKTSAAEITENSSNDFIVSDPAIQTISKEYPTAKFLDPAIQHYAGTNPARRSDNNNIYQHATPANDQFLPPTFQRPTQFYHASARMNLNSENHYSHDTPLDDEPMISPNFQDFINNLAQDDTFRLWDPISASEEVTKNDEPMPLLAMDKFLDDSVPKSSTEFMDSVSSTKNTAHRITHPTTRVGHSETYNKLATSKHHSDPPQIPLPNSLSFMRRRPLGGNSIASGNIFTCSKCNAVFNRIYDLNRHRDSACPQNPDLVKHTCLFHSSLVQFSRADKLKSHMLDKHNMDYKGRDIPKAWRWPLIWRNKTQSFNCELCDAPLGTWPRDKAKFDRHLHDCENGEMARASRYPMGCAIEDIEQMLVTRTKRLSVEEPKQGNGLGAQNEDDDDGEAESFRWG